MSIFVISDLVGLILYDSVIYLSVFDLTAAASSRSITGQWPKQGMGKLRPAEGFHYAARQLLPGSTTCRKNGLQQISHT